MPCRGSLLHCEVIKITDNSTLPGYWDWVKAAKYSGTVVINGKTLDQWQYTVSCNVSIYVQPSKLFCNPADFDELMFLITHVHVHLYQGFIVSVINSKLYFGKQFKFTHFYLVLSMPH